MLKLKDIKVLLLENIDTNAKEYFLNLGCKQVDILPSSLPEDQLIETLKKYHILGIRSRTQISHNLLKNSPQLLAIGCYCIGTNQVDFKATWEYGVSIFNAPFSNTRSVAELTIASIVMLMRNIPQKNTELKKGIWNKSAKNCYEVRGKKLGIVGYGNIGSQVSILASAMGMEVYYYDSEEKLTHGNAQKINSLDSLMSTCDVITLHIPKLKGNKNLINEDKLNLMKDKSYLINYARGDIVDLKALKKSLDKGKILGAALDVFPVEPKGIEEPFVNELLSYENVLLTPHIAGSTQEAQHNIANEVSEKLVKFVTMGMTISSPNFPEVPKLYNKGTHRIINVHKNLPGVISKINKIFSENNINIEGQFLQTNSYIGYVITDIIDNQGEIEQLKIAISKIEENIKIYIIENKTERFNF